MEVVMDSILAYLHMLGIAVLVGKVALLSFVVAPVLARTLDPEQFTTVVRRLFPAYYLMGIAAATGGLIAVSGLGVMRGLSRTIVLSGGVWCLVLASEAYCRSWLTPQSNFMRDQLKEQEAKGAADPQLRSAWYRLHQRSVSLNTVVLIAGLVLLGLAYPQTP